MILESHPRSFLDPPQRMRPSSVRPMEDEKREAAQKEEEEEEEGNHPRKKRRERRDKGKRGAYRGITAVSLSPQKSSIHFRAKEKEEGGRGPFPPPKVASSVFCMRKEKKEEGS